MKKNKYFKNFDPVDDSGVVAWSDFIEPEQVLEAYAGGMFPWPDQEKSIYWFSPWHRGVLDFTNVYWTKKELKFFKKCNYEFKVNCNFELTLKTCAEAKIKLTKGTWITPDLIAAYLLLHLKDKAWSFEVYEAEKLVGGVYGVISKTYFSAESMFYIKPNASKFALFKTVEYLKNFGLSWIDTQIVTDFTSRLGAREISRAEFLARIK